MRSSFRTRSILGCITWWLRPRIQDDFDHWRGWQPWWMRDGVEASHWSASSDAGFWLAAYLHGDGHILRFDRWEVSLFITENIHHLWKQHMRHEKQSVSKSVLFLGFFLGSLNIIFQPIFYTIIVKWLQYCHSESLLVLLHIMWPTKSPHETFQTTNPSLTDKSQNNKV